MAWFFDLGISLKFSAVSKAFSWRIFIPIRMAIERSDHDARF